MGGVCGFVVVSEMAQGGVGTGGLGCVSVQVESRMFTTTHGAQLYNRVAASRTHRRTEGGRFALRVPTPARLGAACDSAKPVVGDRAHVARAAFCLAPTGFGGGSTQRRVHRLSHRRKVQANANEVCPASDEDYESIAALSEGSNGNHPPESPDLDLGTLMKTVAALEKRQQKVNLQTQEILQVLGAATKVLAAKADSSMLRDLPVGEQRNEERAAQTQEDISQAKETEDPYSATVGEHQDSKSAREEQECVVQHPGALCCTKTHIASDAKSKGAVVTLQTTCRGTEGSNSMLEADDYVALASQALADRAAVLSRGAAQNVRGVDENNEEIHRELYDVLQYGAIVDARPNHVVSKFGHPSFLVRLRHKGREVQAIFKPREEGDGEGWHRSSIEWVAYKLNRMLGMDYVPPVAYRTGGVDVDYQHFEEGAFILFVNEVRELREVESGHRGVSLNRLLSDTRILDVLLRNSDRHHGHFLYGEHWAINDYGTNNPMLRPVLIDHAAGFRAEAYVSMEHENAFQTGPVMMVPARTYLRLRFLNAKQVVETFQGVLSESEMRGLLSRRNYILNYIDSLVEQQGYENTVCES